MKRTLALLLMFCMTLAFTAGCGGAPATTSATTETTAGAASETTTAADATAEAGATTVAAEATTAAATTAATTAAAEIAADKPAEELKFVALNYYIRSSEQDDAATVQKAMDEYFMEKLNCTVTIYPVSEWITKMPLVLSSGEQLDLIFDQALTGYYTNAANNLYLPLDDLLNEYGQGIIETANVNCPGLLDAPKIRDVLYGIPCQKQTAQCEAWYFRKDIADKYGMDIDSLVSLQDMEPYLQIIKENEPDMIPYYVVSGTGVNMEWTTDVIRDDPTRYEEITGASNLLIVDFSTNKILNRYETEWDLDRYLTYKSWQDKGYINTDGATTTTGRGDMFRAGKTWFVEGGGAPTTLSTAVQSYGTDFYRWRATGPITNTTQNTSALTCIPRTTVDAERAMMVLNLFHTDKKIIDLFNAGVEGKHYVIDENGRFALPEGKTSRNDTGYNYGYETFFGNMFLNNLWYNENEDRYDELREYNQTARMSRMMGFYADLADITTEFAAVEAVRTQYVPMLKAGIVNDVQAVLDEMNQKMYANGLQKVIDEIQLQFDAFIAG